VGELEKRVTDLSARLEVGQKKTKAKIMMALGLIAVLFLLIVVLLIKGGK